MRVCMAKQASASHAPLRYGDATTPPSASYSMSTLVLKRMRRGRCVRVVVRPRAAPTAEACKVSGHGMRTSALASVFVCMPCHRAGILRARHHRERLGGFPHGHRRSAAVLRRLRLAPGPMGAGRARRCCRRRGPRKHRLQAHHRCAQLRRPGHVCRIRTAREALRGQGPRSAVRGHAGAAIRLFANMCVPIAARPRRSSMFHNHLTMIDQVLRQRLRQ